MYPKELGKDHRENYVTSEALKTTPSYPKPCVQETFASWGAKRGHQGLDSRPQPSVQHMADT